MRFQQITIPYAGRELYPSRYGGEGKSGGVNIKNYGGGLTTGKGGVVTTPGGQDTGGGRENRGGNATSFFAFLSKTSGSFSSLDLTNHPSDTVYITGYRGYEVAQVLVGDITKSAATATYDIQGIPASGLDVVVSGNGTTAASITFTFNSTLPESAYTGTLDIPIAVNINDNSIDPYHYTWYMEDTKCMVMMLHYSWVVRKNESASYYLDLSNQSAQVNCDANGNLYDNSIATLQCTASTSFNGAPATGITYEAVTESFFGATGFSINPTTGVFTFNTAGTKFYWSANYPALPIIVLARKQGETEPIGRKTMTISRNYPGSQGEPAVMRWVETDKNIIRYNPNTGQYSETAVTGTVWKQVGNEMPVQDTGYTIYQWYNNYTPNAYQGSRTAPVNFDGISAVTFGLKNSPSDTEYYEIEDVPVLAEGTNGTEGPQGPQGGVGPQGPQGKDGNKGDSGESAYYLSLTNDNASVNADADGNIYPTAIKPICRGRVFYGTTSSSTATFNVDLGGATGVYTGVTDGVLTIDCSADTFSFTGDVLTISVTGRTDGKVRDVKEMTITKSKAGQNGEPAVSYWLNLSADEVLYNPNDGTITPSSASAVAFMQVGQDDPEDATGVTINACWVRKSDGSETTASATSAVNFSVASFNSYKTLRFKLLKGNKVVDMEEVSMMTNGRNGGTGPQGPAGENAWYLSLTNDNASINCDSAGTIYPTAYHPSTEVWLYNGSVSASDWTMDVHVFDGNTEIQRDPATGDWSYYGISIEEHVYEEDEVVHISHYVIATNSNLQFSSSTLRILIYAGDLYGNERGHKTFTITKSKDGATGVSGQPATSYWLVLSSHDVICESDGSDVRPSTVTASCFKQVGDSAAIPATDAVIAYKKVSRQTGAELTGETTASTVTISQESANTYSIIRFRAYVNGQERDMEEVTIMKNGAVGPQGSSVQGPAVRGPYDYYEYEFTERCWCSGEVGQGCDDCGQWIDVVLQDGKYYYCNTTYYDTLDYGFGEGYWTEGESMDFVAARLILASGASIDFLTNNELKLRDENNHVTGGARGGSGYTFWAGQQFPEDAPFRVDTNGSFSSTTGMIGGWEYDENGLQWAEYIGETDYYTKFDGDGIQFHQGGMDDDYNLMFTKDGGIQYSTTYFDAQQQECNVPYSGAGGTFWIKVLDENTYELLRYHNTYITYSPSTNVTVNTAGYWVIGGTNTYVPRVCRPWKIATLDVERHNQRIVFADGPNTISDNYNNTAGIITNMDLYGADHQTPLFNNAPLDGLRVKSDAVFYRETLHLTTSGTSGSVIEYGTPVINPFGFDMKMAIVTSTSNSATYFTHRIVSGTTAIGTPEYGDYWFFNGDLNTNIKCRYWNSNPTGWSDSYKYIFLGQSSFVNYSWKSLDNFGIPSSWIGMWVMSNVANPTSSSSFRPTGIYGPTFNNRKGNTLYFEV